MRSQWHITYMYSNKWESLIIHLDPFEASKYCMVPINSITAWLSCGIQYYWCCHYGILWIHVGPHTTIQSRMNSLDLFYFATCTYHIIVDQSCGAHHLIMKVVTHKVEAFHLATLATSQEDSYPQLLVRLRPCWSRFVSTDMLSAIISWNINTIIKMITLDCCFCWGKGDHGEDSNSRRLSTVVIQI